MTETRDERRKRILAEREARRKQQNKKESAVYRRWTIFKQQFSVKSYELIQNTKNHFNKYTSKLFWKELISWDGPGTRQMFRDHYNEITINTPHNMKLWLNERRYSLQVWLNTKIGNPDLVIANNLNALLSKELFHYNQTLNNREWLENALEEEHFGITRQNIELKNAVAGVIANANFDLVDRNKSLYDLLIAVNKEREYRKQRELDKYTWGSTEFTIKEQQMRELETAVDANLKEWKQFLEGFNKWISH
jgi:hypothetical protein